MSTWSELWKASQSLPAADRSAQGVISWGSGWESAQTRALDTLLRLALTPIHPAPSCLPTVGQARVLIPSPYTVLPQEERFVCPGGTQNGTVSRPRTRRNVFSGHVSSPAWPRESPLLHKSPPQPICIWPPSWSYLQRCRNDVEKPTETSQNISKAICLYSGLLPGKASPSICLNSRKPVLWKRRQGRSQEDPWLWMWVNSRHHLHLSQATHPPHGRGGSGKQKVARSLMSLFIKGKTP